LSFAFSIFAFLAATFLLSRWSCVGPKDGAACWLVQATMYVGLAPVTETPGVVVNSLAVIYGNSVVPYGSED